MDHPQLDLSATFAAHPQARTILRTLHEHGYEAVFIGGMVRDALRAHLDPGGRPASNDVDIATEATPEQIQAAFPAWPTKAVGKAFGVLLLEAPDGQVYELATFRTESDYDGRRPGNVELIRSLKQDVARRDFTVNGLAARLDGTLIDFVGGVDDLRHRRIRTIGDPFARFDEDALRMMRAVRFACALDAEIEPRTADAIRARAARLDRVSAERVQDEFFGTLATPRARRGVELLDELDLLVRFLPELDALKGVPQPKQYHPEGDVYVHTLLALDWADRLQLDALAKLCVLLHDVGKPQALAQNAGAHMGGHDRIGEVMVLEIGQRLRLSARQLRTLAFTTREHMRVAHLVEMSEAKRLRFLSGGHVPIPPAWPPASDALTRLLQVLVCDAQASAHQASGWLPVYQAAVRGTLRLWDLEQREAVTKLLDGNDLVQMGLFGPPVGLVLKMIYERVFSGSIHSRDQALEQARELMGQLDEDD